MFRQAFVKVGIVVAILLIAVARPVTAEVITINRGVFTYPAVMGGGNVDIAGNRGFKAEASTQTGFFNAFTQCSVPECPPGAVVEIDAGWSGNDLPGTARFRGAFYPDLGGLASPNSLGIQFSGQIKMPPMSDGPVSVTVPFDFAGEFFYAPDLETPRQRALLTGGGFATFHLQPFSDGMTWLITSAEFEFRPVKR